MAGGVHQFASVPQWQRERFEKPYSARSSRDSRTTCPVTHLMRRSDCLSDETGLIPVQGASSQRSVAQPVARLSRGQEDAGSNPVTPTNSPVPIAQWQSRPLITV